MTITVQQLDEWREWFNNNTTKTYKQTRFKIVTEIYELK